MGNLKQTLREQYKKRRAALAKEVRAAADSAILRNVINLRQYQDAGTIMAYSAIGSEVKTDAIIKDALTRGKTVLLPVTDSHTETMFAAQLTIDGGLIRGGYNILEPKDAHPYIGAVDLVLVPGLVFNAKGHRIGYGKGYYDKFFAAGTSAVKVGLAYLCQISTENFGEAHDIQMDYILTEQGGIVCDV